MCYFFHSLERLYVHSLLKAVTAILEIHWMQYWYYHLTQHVISLNCTWFWDTQKCFQNSSLPEAKQCVKKSCQELFLLNVNRMEKEWIRKSEYVRVLFYLQLHWNSDTILMNSFNCGTYQFIKWIISLIQHISEVALKEVKVTVTANLY